ncbi:MAG TPA: TonB-dependent receptor [Steroidobacteraceae bacterium]|nr:TonB-dependent receptor [Steroidobacteraceae bacterium]
MTDRTTGFLGRSAGLFVLACALIAAGPAFGQSATNQTTTGQTPADQTAQAGTATGALQEVVVTAERRAEDVQTTPISVVAVSGDQLQAQQITSVQSLQQIAPNLTVTNGGTTQYVNIRGIGYSPVGGDGQNGIAMVHDGLSNNEDGVGLNAPYFDIADVEVLRGPQGTFAGVNSTGGAIEVTSQDPNFRGVNGYATAQVATYSDTRFQGAVNLPATDTVALRLAFNEETSGSYFYDEGAEEDGPDLGGPHFIPGSGPTSNKTIIDPGNIDNRDARFGVLWKPTDDFQSLTKIEIDNDDSQGVPAQPNINSFSPLPGKPCPPGEGTAPVCHNLYYPGYSGSPYVLNNWDTGLLDNQSIDYYGEELRYTLPGGIVLRSMSGDQEINVYTNSSSTNDSINYGYTYATQTVHTYSEEIDAISPTTGQFSWITGAAWAFNREEFTSFGENYGPPFNTPAGPDITLWNREFLWIKTEGVFGQMTWQFTPTLQLLVGVRENWDQEPSHAGGLVLSLPPPYKSELTHNSIGWSDSLTPTGKVGLNWTPVQGQFFYAFWARGYKPGENNQGSTPPANKETTHDYELGWKGTLAGGHVLTQLGGYYTQYYSMIETIFDPNNATSSAGANIPFSIIKGIEASLQSQLGRFSFNVSAALNKSILGPLVDAETYKFPAGFGITNQCTAGEVPNATNSNCTDYKPYLIPLSGEELPFAPLFSAHASIQYAIPIGDMDLTPRVVYSYQDKSYSSLFQSDDYFLLPGHSVVDGYLDWTAGRWKATVYATNLADVVYLNGPGLYSNPRQIGLQVNATF